MRNWNWDAVVEFFSWAWAVLIGVGAKLAYEGMDKPLKKRYVAATFVMAVFSGFLLDRLAASYGVAEGTRGIITSVGALTCDTVVKQLLTTNWKDVLKIKKQ